MRIQRLDLLRYGRFTDTHIELPAGPSDIHILFGPNEAGKSTALCAIEDLLFGIDPASLYNFLHDSSSMRVGAVLQNGETKLEVRRRKGRKDTLLTPRDVPVPSGSAALVPYLEGVDRTFFSRMFSLDHGRLRKGGQEILEARDEVGQMLFSASAGLSGLRGELKSLNDEADGLWTSRKAAHRKYYQAAERLDVADKQLREHTVSAVKWQETKRASDDAQETYDALEKQIEQVSTEQRKLSRIRRVYRDSKKITILADQIAALGEVVPLPENAYSSLESSERELASATARVETLNEDLEREWHQRDALTLNEDLLLRNDDIQQFHKRRIEVQKEKADLPNRRAELAIAEGKLRRAAQDLEWESNDIAQVMTQIPQRAKIAAVRSMLNSRGEKAAGVANAKSAVEEVENQINDIQQELDNNPVPADVSRLAAVLKAARQSGDIASRISTVESAIREANVNIARRLKSLKPQVAEEVALTSIPVPPRDTIVHHRDAELSADRKIDACRERILTTEQELARHQKARDRLARDEDAVTSEEITSARTRRDSGWSLIRRRFIEAAAVPEDEIRAFTGTEADLPITFEAAIKTADDLTDHRFEHADAAAQITITSRQIVELQELLTNFRDQERLLLKDRHALESLWLNMWAEAPFVPLTPDAMLEWLNCRNELLEAITRRACSEHQLQELRKEDSTTKASILAELSAIAADVSALEHQPLRVVMEAAATCQSRHETDSGNRRQSVDRLRKMKAEGDRKRKALETAAKAWADWEIEWAPAIKALGLDPATHPEVVAARLDEIDHMREIAQEINQLRHERIGKIERDILVFTQDVKALLAAVANDLVNATPEDAIIDLERRLDDAKRIREQRKNKDTAISNLQKRIEDCENSVLQARATIRNLLEAAAVTDIEQLKIAIRNSDQLRQLERERSMGAETLAKEGDGLSLDELAAECADVDIDQIAAREQTLEQELKNLRARLMEAAERRTQTRNALNNFGGDARAAEAAALRQAALAEMREAVEQYVRVRSSATLLQWAIERYRREKQAPLLKRTGEIFAMLTGNSFIDLRLEFNDDDSAQLAGLRPDGRLVRINGMSTGTADQLYLALRVASVEDYLTRANAVPFVADDLFINFDNERAAAGFNVLGQLAQKTQILFFTHHEHLVEIARSTLGSSVRVVSLVDRPIAQAA